MYLNKKTFKMYMVRTFYNNIKLKIFMQIMHIYCKKSFLKLQIKDDWSAFYNIQQHFRGFFT